MKKQTALFVLYQYYQQQHSFVPFIIINIIIIINSN